MFQNIQSKSGLGDIAIHKQRNRQFDFLYNDIWHASWNKSDRFSKCDDLYNLVHQLPERSGSGNLLKEYLGMTWKINEDKSERLQNGKPRKKVAP